MKTLRPTKRSVSPFALPEQDSLGVAALFPENKTLFSDLAQVLSAHFPSRPESFDQKHPFKTLEDLVFLPEILDSLTHAPANDAPILSDVCHFLTLFRAGIEEKGLAAAIDQSMGTLFDKKTEVFLIDHHNREHCEKMGRPDEYRDVVLFSKERDMLVGRYFAVVTEQEPGKFSEFVSKWQQSDNLDRVLHFLDFCAGTKNPTFEHYLLSSHLAFSRFLRDKAHLKTLFEKAQPLLKKLTSPTWEKDTRTQLGLS